MLFGAGNVGREVLQVLRRAHVEPVAFLDETPGKVGGSIDGVSVLSPHQALTHLSDPPCVVVTIMNARHHYLETEERFERELGLSTLPFLALPWRLDGVEEMAFQTGPARLLAGRDRILKLRDKLEDEQSRGVLTNQVHFRLSLDYSSLQPAQPSPYFPDDLELNLPSAVHFIDAGAYDGDTVASFLRHRGEDFSGITACEPDPQTFARLVDYVGQQPPQVRDRIHARRVAIGGRRGVLRFRASADMNSAFDPAGETTVPVETLETLLDPIGGPLYIKLDIEGAETEAIRSAASWIKRRRPKLAVSVYHLPTDLWDLPLTLLDLDAGYRLSLRNHGIEGTDVVAYAL